MEKSEVQTWVDANLKGLQAQYGIPHWEIEMEYILDENIGLEGECTTLDRYEKAIIKINVPHMKDTGYLEKVFRHELSHIIHGPFHMYWRAVCDAIEETEKSEALLKALDCLWHDAQELTVKNIERMSAGHRTKGVLDGPVG